MKRNRYTKALKQLKSTKIDEKIERLEEKIATIPTNNTAGVYGLNPAGYKHRPKDPAKIFVPDKDGNWPAGVPGVPGESTYTRPEGWWDNDADWDNIVRPRISPRLIGEDGKSTEGLIADDGTVQTALPPGTRHFILGPLVDAFVPNHGYDGYLNIGYLQKDTRAFVLLGRISGQWEANHHNASAPVWDGTSTGFTSYNGNFTLEHAQWFRTQILNKRFTKNLPYNYSGGIPQSSPWPPAGGWPDWFPDWLEDLLDGMFGGSMPGAGTGGDANDDDNEDGQPDEPGAFGDGETEPDTGDEHTQGDSDQGGAEDAGFPWFPFGNLGDKAKDLWDKIKDSAGDIKDNLGDFFDDAFDDAVEGAKDFRDSLQDSLDNWTGGGKDKKPYVNLQGAGGTDEPIDQVDNWVNKVKDFVKSIPGKAKSAVDTLKLAKSGIEAVPTSADAVQQYLNNNDPNHPDYRKNDPRSDNYEGPYEPPTDATWKNDVGKQIKNSIPKWSDMEKRAKESPDGKTQLTNLEITTISNNMKPISGNGDMRFHTFLNSLPVSGNESGDEVPGEDGNTPITTFTLDKDGNIEIVTNYRFSDRDDVSSGGPLMKLYVQSYMDKDKGTEGTFPFYDKDSRYDNRTQVGTTHDVNMRLRLNINGGNSSTWPARATDVKNFKTGMMKLMNSYYPEGEFLKESYGPRKVKFVVNEIATAAPAPTTPTPTTPTTQTTTQQSTTEKTESKKTADALAKEYIEKNGPKKTQELIDKTDEYIRSHGQDGDTKIAATDYKNLKGWEQDILQNGLKSKPGGSQWENELKRLQQMYPGFYPRVQLDDSEYEVAQYKEPDSDYAKNVPSWFWYSGNGPAVWSMYKGKAVIWGYNYSGGFGYIIPGPGSGEPGTPESGYGTPGFNWDNQSGGTSWTFVLYEPEVKTAEVPINSPQPKPEPEPEFPPDYEIAGVNYDLYNWMLKAYPGSGAAQWYLNNPTAPSNRNPFLPPGSYVPKANLPSDSPYSVASLTGVNATDAAILSARRKKKGKNKKNIMVASYKPEGRRLQESDLNLSRRHVRMLKEIKKPVLVPELPKKYKMNFKGKFKAQNTPDVTASKQTSDGVKAQNAAGQAWREQDKNWSRYETTERMNVVHDQLGHGEQAWNMIIDEARRKNGWKNREIQEQLNIIAAEKAMRQIDPDYISPWSLVEQGDPNKDEIEIISKDPLVKRVAKRLKQEIDYPDKPSRKGYPDTPPKKQVDGWHPDYGKKYKYDKLDPISADTMSHAPTGDPEIDSNVQKARKLKKKRDEVTESSKCNKKRTLKGFKKERKNLNEMMITDVEVITFEQVKKLREHWGYKDEK